MSDEPAITQGDYPSVLYRAFSDEAHAREFAMNGRIRFGSLGYYTALEDAARQDSDEGEGRIRSPGEVEAISLDHERRVVGRSMQSGLVNHHSFLTNVVYILSCGVTSRGEPPPALARFGASLVRINAPRRFGQALTDALWNGADIETASIVECAQVEYSKDGIADREVTRREAIRLSYVQKSAVFAEECEYRFVVVANMMRSGLHDRFLWVEIPEASEYMEIVS